jgi:hypothetical protein
VPTQLKLPFMRPIKFRQQWWCRGVGRVSGWVTQQIIKLSAVDLTSAPFLIFIDSDVILIRSLDLATLLTASGASYLHQSTMRAALTKHQHWYRAARKLLTVNDESAPLHNYIGNLIVWRAAIVKALQARLTTLHHEPWQRAVARTRDFSEYMLYGVYASEVHPAADVHVFKSSELTCSVWTSKGTLVAEDIAKGILPGHVALHLQSTLPLLIKERRSLCRKALEQDEAQQRISDAGLADAAMVAS